MQASPGILHRGLSSQLLGYSSDKPNLQLPSKLKGKHTEMLSNIWPSVALKNSAAHYMKPTNFSRQTFMLMNWSKTLWKYFAGELIQPDNLDLSAI